MSGPCYSRFKQCSLVPLSQTAKFLKILLLTESKQFIENCRLWIRGYFANFVRL